MSGLPFEFEVPVWFFEKGNAPKGQQRRVGGIISTELPDYQGETVLSDGLDLSYFAKSGWFNDNHEKGMKGIVGYPDKKSLKKFRKGDSLPNGKLAPANGVWAEGYILNNEKGNSVWDLAQSLQDTDRQLGFSVEGQILRRTGPKTILKKAEDGKVKRVGNRVAHAVVRNVAVTHCPVNDSTGLEILAKSLEAAEVIDIEDMETRIATLEKALTMGPPTDTVPEGPQKGEGAGRVLARQNLDAKGAKDTTKRKKKEEEEDEAKKALTDAEAIAWLQKAQPSLNAAVAGRIVELTKKLKRQGKL